jgi:hypothetical protein
MDTRSPSADILIKTFDVEFFSLPPTDKYPIRLLVVFADGDSAELSEVGKK